MTLRHLQMKEVLREAVSQYMTAIAQGLQVIIVVPGGFADFDIGYGVGKKPAHTGVWLKRQLMALGVSEVDIIVEPYEFGWKENICDSSTEAFWAEGVLLSHTVRRVIIPANGPHGRRILRSWQRIARISGRKIPVQIVKVPNLMGAKWTVLDMTIRWALWLWDPLCEKFPSRGIIDGRRSATAGINRDEAIRRTNAGEYDLER